jgi:hypothetical protein
MRLGPFIALALFGAIQFGSPPARADDAAVNSQAPNGEDRLGPTLVNGAFGVLSQGQLIDAQ